MIWLGILFGLLALLWCAGTYYIWLTQDEKIFPGDGQAFGETEALRALGGKVLQAQRDGQSLRWYQVGAEKSAALMLLFHGNRDGALERLAYAAHLKPLGISLALIEYPGYAGEKGPTNEWAVLRNALAAYDELETRNAKLPLFVMGESLGTGPATYVCTLRKPKGLLLSTPYSSMAAVAQHRYPWMPIRPFIRHPIDAWRWAPHVDCPVLALHGTKDETIPFKMGKKQAERFRNLETFVEIEGAGHSNLRDIGQGVFWHGISDFIKRHC
jgi:alpha-beta hydrolase superfamily lysophospholipase